MYQLIAIPLISAFIGYVTNVVAIKLLFWPEKPVSFILFELYGLLPKRRRDIARAAGEIVEEQLLSLDDLFEQIDTPQIRESLVDRISEIIRDRIYSIVPDFVPSRITSSIVSGMNRVLRQEADDIIKQVITASQSSLNDEVQVKKIVEDKINDLDIQQLEEMVCKVSATELKFIEILGGVLGFLIGVVQVCVLLLFPL